MQCTLYKNCSHYRELRGNAVTAIILRIFPVNLAVIPQRWSNLLRGYHGNGAFVCGNTKGANVWTLKSELWTEDCPHASWKKWKSKSQQWTKLGQVASGLLGITVSQYLVREIVLHSWVDCEWAVYPTAEWWQSGWTVISPWSCIN